MAHEAPQRKLPTDIGYGQQHCLRDLRQASTCTLTARCNRQCPHGPPATGNALTALNGQADCIAPYP
eukprot:364864-Chlamydomonas_euryale.AAC.2